MMGVDEVKACQQFALLAGRRMEELSRAEHWPKSLLPSFFYDPQYRLVHAFAERSPINSGTVNLPNLRR